MKASTFIWAFVLIIGGMAVFGLVGRGMFALLVGSPLYGLTRILWGALLAGVLVAIFKGLRPRW